MRRIYSIAKINNPDNYKIHKVNFYSFNINVIIKIDKRLVIDACPILIVSKANILNNEFIENKLLTRLIGL